MEMCKNAVRRFSEMDIVKSDGVEPSSRTLKLVNHDQLVELVNDMESYRRWLFVQLWFYLFHQLV